MNNIAQNFISTIFFLACVIFTVPDGQISGKFGLKRSLIIGTSIYFLSCLIICFSPSTIFFMIVGLFRDGFSYYKCFFCSYDS